LSIIIVPIAGPDFYSEKFGIRPLYPVEGTTILEHVLSMRPWYSRILSGADQLIFVLREDGLHTVEMLGYIAAKFPFSNTVVMNQLTAGAPMSVLAGIALVKDHNTPIIIDLADVAFTCTCEPVEYFYLNPNVDGIVPYFNSQDPKFSYLKLQDRRVVEAREKQLISENASAGVYIFRDTPTYLRAVIYCIQHPETCKIAGNFFVCPLVNGLISTERDVHAIKVNNVRPIGAIFH
jgi:hypothetical protein